MKRFLTKLKTGLTGGLMAAGLMGLFFVVGISPAMAATSGPNNASVGVDLATIGTAAWSSAVNITTAGNASTAMSTTSVATHYLKGTGYGFNIPAYSTINGITVTINRSAGSNSSIHDNVVSLVKGGVILGDNKASTSTWTTTMSPAVYGGTSDLWGTTWTPADINNANFGAVLSVINTVGASRSANVDYITITVTYTPPIVNAAASTVVVSNDLVNTSGGSTVITVTAKDGDGNPIANIASANINITATGASNTITRLSSETDSAGVYSAMLQSTTAETKIVSVTINGTLLNQHPSVNFYSSSPARVNLTANLLTTEASLSGATTNLDAYVTDGHSNAVPDNSPVWVAPFTSAPHGTPVSSCPQASQSLTDNGHAACRITFNYKGDVRLQVNGSNGVIFSEGDTVVHFVDTTKPVIALTGSSTVTTEYRGTYADLGATANDNIDQNITSSIVTVNPVDTNTVMYNPTHAGKVVGSYTVTYNVKDGSNNAADQVARTVNVIDTTAPIVTSLTSDATASGWLKVGNKIKFTLALAPAEPLAAVAGSYNGQTLTWTTADAGATYTATYTVAEGDVDHNTTALQISGVTVTDVAGNVTTTAGSDVAKHIDAHTPVAPVVDLPPYVNIANVAAVPMTVTGEAGTVVHYTVGTVTGSGTIDSTGSFDVDLNLSPLPQGAVNADVTLTDAAGNVSAIGSAPSIKDTIAPAAPIIALPTFVNTLNQNAPYLSGTGEARATVSYHVSDSAATEISGTGAVTPGTTIHFTSKDLTALLDGALTLSATQTDLAGNTSLAGVTTSTKETVKPTLVSLDSDGKRYSSLTYPITATFSEAVTAPKIAIAYGAAGCADVAATAMTATTTANAYTYNLVITDACLAAHATVTISNATDLAGNIINADSSHSFVVDTVPPVFSAISPAMNAFIKADFTVGYTLSEDLASGSLNFYLGSDSENLEHSYALSGDELKAGVHVIPNASLLAAGVTLTEGEQYILLSGNDLATNEGNDAVGFITYDITPPTVLDVTSTKADGSYKAGEVIDITVKFSEIVNATTRYVAGGCGYWGDHCWDTIDQRPYLNLNTGATNRTALYEGGTGTDTLTFRYTVQAGDTSADLDYLASGALSLNGQSIRDRAGNDGNLSLATPGAEHSLGFNKNLIIDTTAPTVVLATANPNPTNTMPIAMTATFSEPVSGFEAVDVAVTNGTVNNFAGSGTSYTFDVVPAADGSVTIDVPVSVAVDAALNGNTASNQIALVYDATKPVVSSVVLKEGAAVSDGLVKASDVLTIDATFSEAMATTPVPTVALSGANTLAAVAMTRVDATHYTYNYTVVAPGDGDTTITIDGGKDLAANSQVADSATKFVVDNTKPVITQHAAVIETANELGGKVVTYTVVASDTHDGALTAVCTPASGTKFAVSQATVVHCDVTDQAGNAADTMTFAVTVNPDAITKLLVNATSPHKTNETSAVTVTGKDQYGNTTTNQSGTIVVVSVDNGGVLGNTILTLAGGTAATTLQKAVAGIATVTVSSGSLTPGNTQVEFTQVDTTGPVVTEVHPAQGATDVSISAPSFIVFNEVLKLASVNSANVQLWQAAVSSTPAVQVPATVSLVEGGLRVNITPNDPLAYGAAYYFVVTAGVTDESGNALATLKDGSNTGFVTARNTADLTAPTIIAYSPVSGSPVAITVAPSVTFSEALKPGTVSSATAKLLDASDLVVPAAVSLVEGGTRIIITPTVALASSAGYHFTVTTGITDEAGNALDETANYAFTTEAPKDATAPVVTDFVAGSLTSSSAILTVTTDENAVCRYSDVEKAFADMTAMAVNEGTAHSQSLTGLASATTYNYYVRCQDISGNTMATSAHVSFATKPTIATGVSVDAVSMIKMTGSADNSYASGWEWRMLVTLPDAENMAALKFADWTSGTSTLAAGGNMQYYFEQIPAGLGSAAAPVAVSAANTYPEYVTINPASDVSASTPGIQTYVHVMVKIPSTTASGSYSTSYQVRSQASAI